MMELHELVHITTGRIICGSWGSRDFNVWRLSEGCEIKHSNWWLATLAGPLFSFMLMWAGMALLFTANIKKQAIGFSLIFANIPFGRISQVMMGGGDEMVVARHLLNTQLSRNSIIILCSIVVLIIGLPPLYRAWRVTLNKKAWVYIFGGLTLPLAFVLGYVLTALNTILNSGFLAQSFIMGTPIFITLHTILVVTLLALLYKNLLLLNRKA